MTGEQKASVETPSLPTYPDLYINRQSTRVALGDAAGKTHIIEIPSGRILRVFDTKEPSLAWSRDGTRLAASDGIWSIESGERVVPMEKVDNCGTLRKWSEDAHRLAFNLKDYNIMCLFDDMTGRLVAGVDSAIAKAHNRQINTINFVANNTRIITSSDDESARLWDAKTGAFVALMGTPRRTMDQSVEIAWRGMGLPIDISGGDRSRIVTAHPDRTVRVWDAFTGAPLAVLTGQTEEIRSVAIDALAHALPPVVNTQR